jgi:hypothetical protein
VRNSDTPIAWFSLTMSVIADPPSIRSWVPLKVSRPVWQAAQLNPMPPMASPVAGLRHGLPSGRSIGSASRSVQVNPTGRRCRQACVAGPLA